MPLSSRLRQGSALALALLCLAMPLTAAEAPEFSGVLEGEWGQGFRDARVQKAELVFRPELRWNLGSGNRLKAQGRLRFDAFDRLEPGHPTPTETSSLTRRGFVGDLIDFELRELTFETEIGRTWLTLGKQQIVWGQADGLKVLDVVNPQDFREFILDDFDDSRIPLWTAQAEIPIGDANLQLLWIPDPSFHEFPDRGATFAFTAGRFGPPQVAGFLPVLEEPNRPRRLLSDSDAGARLSTVWRDFDLSLNYLYHYDDRPHFEAERRSGGVLLFTPEYERTHLLGGTFSSAFGDLTVRGELGWTSARHLSVDDARDEDLIRRAGEIAYVLGLDWFGFRDSLVSFQVFQSYLLDDQDWLRDRVDTNLTLLARREFMNERLRLEAIWIHNVGDGDGLVRPKVRYELRTGLAIWAGVDVFYGGPGGAFGEFDGRDRATFGFEWGF